MRGGKKRRVYDIFCAVTQRLQQGAFAADRLGDGDLLRDGDGVLAAGFLVAALNDSVVGVQKQDVIGNFFGIQIGKRRVQLLAGAHAAHVHNDRHAGKLVFALQGEVHDTRQQRGGNVINAEKTDVLQRIDSHRLARTGQTCNNYKIHRLSP